MVLAAWLMVRLTGDVAQWVCVAIGSYAVISWCQATAVRDPDFFACTFGNPAFRASLAGTALLGGVNGAAGFWAIPHAIRDLHIPPQVAGLTYGLTLSLGSAVGVLLFGALADRWRRRDPRAYLWVVMLCAGLAVPCAFLMYTTASHGVFLLSLMLFGLTYQSWAGAIAAQVQDFVLPRMRASASASLALTVTLVVFAIGPYSAGKVSSLTGSLSGGVLWMFVVVPVALLLLLLSTRSIRADPARS
jgi:MFS family permease